MKTFSTKLTRNLCCLAVAALCFLLSTAVLATAQDAADVIMLQGTLLNDDGSVRPDGDYMIAVGLFDVPLGGMPIAAKGNLLVRQEFGAFSVELPRSLAGNEPNVQGVRKFDRLWWSVIVEGKELTPRLRIAAVPLATTARYAESSRGEMPIGSLTAFAGDVNSVPDGWLICDGSLVSAQKYPALAKVLGERFNDEGGETENQFRLPDMRGMIVVGSGTNRINPITDATTSAKSLRGTGANRLQTQTSFAVPHIEMHYIIRAK